MMFRRWKLYELADFESLLSKAEVRSVDCDRVTDALASNITQSESNKRKIGLRAWFKGVCEDYPGKSREASERLRLALSLVQILVIGCSLLLGCALMAGLIERVGITEGKAYNVWKLLAIPLGGQWFFLFITILSWLILRRNERKFTLLEQVIAQIVKRFSGTEGQRGWNELYRSGATYRSILSWRIASITQWGAVAFNIGLIGSFLAILLFLEINFFWATSLQDFGEPQLRTTTELLSVPWSWSTSWFPTVEQLLLTQLQQGELNPKGEPEYWYPFLLASFVIWGMLPRLVLALLSHCMEYQALGKLTFMERRHRELWRELTPRVSSTATYAAAEDGVILIDVGGTNTSLEQLRPFLLQTLRLNPIKSFRAGVLEGDEKDQALNSLQTSKRGVILLVESWNLSPKQLKVMHQRLRKVIQDRPILFLIIGLPSNGVIQPPAQEDLAQWEHFVAELQDPEAELITYAP